MKNKIESIMADFPKVSIAVPTYNRLKFLKRVVGSALAQNYPNFEIIISDNASTDGTSEYLKSLHDSRIKVLLNSENIGMAANWDNCLRAACGKYFMLLSDDDALNGNDALEKLMAGFTGASTENVGMVFSDVMLEYSGRVFPIRTSAKSTFYNPPRLVADFFSNRVSIFPCATLLRTEDMIDVGGYASFNASLAVDACMWITIAFKYDMVIRVAEPVAIYRIHQSLTSSSIETWDKDYEMIRAVVQSHRLIMTEREFLEINRAVTSAWKRVPMGYMAKKIKYDKEYGLFSVIKDAFIWRHRLFTFSNFHFVIKKYFMR